MPGILASLSSSRSPEIPRQVPSCQNRLEGDASPLTPSHSSRNCHLLAPQPFLDSMDRKPTATGQLACSPSSIRRSASSLNSRPNRLGSLVLNQPLPGHHFPISLSVRNILLMRGHLGIMRSMLRAANAVLVARSVRRSFFIVPHRSIGGPDLTEMVVPT